MLRNRSLAGEERGFCSGETKGALMGGTLASRLPFLFAAAIIAAGLGDPVVESISNTGIFGGHYADNNHLGVVPALLAGAGIALEVLALRFLEVWRRSTNRSRDSLLSIARDIGAGSIARDFPVVFGLQLISLFALESGEQLVVGGKPLSGTAWLGGPLLFGLMAHAIIGGLCTLTLGACMRASVRGFATFVQRAIQFIWLAVVPLSGASFWRKQPACSCARAQAPHVREIGGRAPPLLQTPGFSYIS